MLITSSRIKAAQAMTYGVRIKAAQTMTYGVRIKAAQVGEGDVS